MTIIISGGHPSDWGLIPTFLDENDPHPAREQFDAKYVAGWNKFDGFTFDRVHMTLKYPGDPLMEPMSAMRFKNELILLYPHAWVCIVQLDDTWEAARMD